MNKRPGGATRAWVGPAVVSTTTLFVVVVVVATADTSGHPVAWLGVLPIAASLWMTLRQTALVAIGSIALAVGLAAVEVGAPTSRTALGVLTVSVLGLIAALNSAFNERASDRLGRATMVARTLQDVVRTELPASAAGVRLATWRSASDTDVDLGGDVVDVVETRSGSRLIVGDVMGHGLGAVKLAAGVATAFRAAAADAGQSLVDVAAAVDTYVVEHVGDEEFVTAVFLGVRRKRGAAHRQLRASRSLSAARRLAGAPAVAAEPVAAPRPCAPPSGPPLPVGQWRPDPGLHRRRAGGTVPRRHGVRAGGPPAGADAR